MLEKILTCCLCAIEHCPKSLYSEFLCAIAQVMISSHIRLVIDRTFVFPLAVPYTSKLFRFQYKQQPSLQSTIADSTHHLLLAPKPHHVSKQPLFRDYRSLCTLGRTDLEPILELA